VSLQWNVLPNGMAKTTCVTRFKLSQPLLWVLVEHLKNNNGLLSNEICTRTEAGIVGSNPTQGMDVCVCVCAFLVFVYM
jgi:hypothetical protein